MRTRCCCTTTTAPRPGGRNQMQSMPWRWTSRTAMCRSMESDFQLHIDLLFDDPNTLASLASNMQRFAALGLILHITELDIRLSDSSAASFNAQAKLYGEIATICVQQPACKLFQ